VAIPALIYMQPRLGLTEIILILGTAAIHIGYFLLLQQGYRAGDLSLVYPLARGTGPVLSTTAAILIFGERPGLIAIAGAALVAVGVFWLTGGSRLFKNFAAARWAIIYGLLTGLLIASYTLWDKQAVSTYGMTPLLLYFASMVVRATVLSLLVALPQKDKARYEWRQHRKEAFWVGFLSPLSYFMVLTALVFTPVSYVAPAREISILIGTVMGARLLAEGEATRRIAAASAMVLGVIALALG
jgi:drug/metabolite transporter (DMT)-like permease